MTTQSKVSSLIEVAPQHHFSWPMTLAILMLGLLLGVLASNLFIASTIGVSEAPQRVRPNLTDLAKEDALTVYRQSERTLVPYTSLHLNEEGLAQYHQSEWGNRADMSVSITANEINTRQHDREYGLAAFGVTGTETRILAWPPRPTLFYPVEAEAGLAVYHQSEWGLALNKAEADEDIGLMEFSSVPN